MTEPHEFESCVLEEVGIVCEMCTAYREGVADGKDKMALEVLAVFSSRHNGFCACRPCILVRSVLAAGLPFSWKATRPATPS